MIEVQIGDRVRATCRYTYAGPNGIYTFGIELGTWIPPVFNTLARWELQNISISAGSNKTQVIEFVIPAGLTSDVTYDMNWEIGTGSQLSGDWKIIKRTITDDIIRMVGESVNFSNLSVSYEKA